MSESVAKMNRKCVDLVQKKVGDDLECGLGCRFVDAEESSTRVSALKLRSCDPRRISCDKDVNQKVSERFGKRKEREGEGEMQGKRSFNERLCASSLLR